MSRPAHGRSHPGLLRVRVLEGFFLLGILMDLCELSAVADSTLTCKKWEGTQTLLHHTSLGYFTPELAF